MDELISSLLLNGSPLVVLVIVVWLFLKHMAAGSKDLQDLLRQFHGDHILARKETKEAVDANTSAMTENTIAIRELAESVRTCPLKSKIDC